MLFRSVSQSRYVRSVLDEEGVRLAEPKLKVTGIEAVRSSTPELIKTYIKEALKLSFEAFQNELYEYIEQKRDEFRSKSFGDVAFPRGVKDLTKYTDHQNIYAKGCPMHVRAELVYNHHIKKLGLENKYELIKDGDKIKFCELQMLNKY